jgi:rhodanese-related sulfurtransferase
MSEAIGIGFFQFDNLVKNKVPCVYFVFDCKIETICNQQELEHIRRYQLNHLQPFEELEEKKYRKIDPILCLCEDGLKSKSLADELSLQGFINAYFVEGGLVKLLQDQKQQL